MTWLEFGLRQSHNQMRRVCPFGDE